MIVAFIALLYTLFYRDKRLARNVVLTFCGISGSVLGLMDSDDRRMGAEAHGGVKCQRIQHSAAADIHASSLGP